MPARRWRIASVLALVTAGGGASQAETLEDAWIRAVQQDRSLAAVRSQAEAAQLESQAARAERWPTVAVGGSFTQLDSSPAFDFAFTGVPVTAPALFANDNYAMASAALTLPLFTSGRISSGIAAAAARHRGADARALAAESDLKLAVADAYVGLLRARKSLAVARSNVTSLGALAADVSAMFERELSPKNDLLAVQVALADARQNELRAANALDVALAVYNRLLGEPLDRAVDIVETLPDPIDVPRDLATLVTYALGHRAELTAIDSQTEAFAQLARTERARVLPQLALTGGYYYLENQFLDDETVGAAGIGVQWALFDGGQARKRAAAMQRSSRASEEQRADLASLIELQVRQAWLDVAEARQRIGVTAHAAEQADENLRIARELYRAGLGTQTQLLEAESLRVQALTNRDNAVTDAGLARLRLARAIGAI
jgi:outer membrane protein TolC